MRMRKPIDTRWRDYSAPGSYVLTAGGYTFTLTGTNPNGGDNTALVDGIKLFLGSTNALANQSFEHPILASGTFVYRPSTANVIWSFTNLKELTFCISFSNSRQNEPAVAGKQSYKRAFKTPQPTKRSRRTWRILNRNIRSSRSR